MCFRPLSQADRELFLELFTCAQTMRYIGAVLTPAQAQSMFERLRRGDGPAQWRYWALLSLESGRSLGLASVEAGATVAFGLMMRAAARGQGLGREAFDALLAEAVRAAGPARLLVRVHPEHPVMARWVREAGFQWMGAVAGQGDLWRRQARAARVGNVPFRA